MNTVEFDDDELDQAKARLTRVYKTLRQRFPSRLPSELEDEPADLKLTEMVIRSILAIPEDTPIPAHPQEVLVVRYIVGTMNKLNPKWRQTTQVAYEVGLNRLSEPPRGAYLQDRFLTDDADGARGLLQGGELRKIFFLMLNSCLSFWDTKALSQGIRLRVPVGTELPEYGGCMAMAEFLLPHLQRYMEFEVSRLYLPKPYQPGEEDYEVESCRANNARIKKGFEALLQYAPMWHGLSPEPAEDSGDSLFAKLMLNASLNKTLLEQWGMEAKAREMLTLQMSLLERLQSSCDGGLDDLIEEFSDGHSVDYLELCRKALDIPRDEKRGLFSEHILLSISAQIDALMRSPILRNFKGEGAANQLLLSPDYDGVKAETWSWLALMYCRKQGIAFKQVDPRFKGNDRALVTSHARPPIEDGELMTTLRRLVSSLSFAHHEFDFSAERQQLHFEFVQDVRYQKISTMERILRRNSLAGWKALVDRLVMSNFIPGTEGEKYVTITISDLEHWQDCGLEQQTCFRMAPAALHCGREINTGELPMPQLQDLDAQILKLQQERARIVQEQKNEVLKEVRGLIQQYEITAKDLGFSKHGVSVKPIKGKASAMYRNQKGQEWSGGSGARPAWVREIFEQQLAANPEFNVEQLHAVLTSRGYKI